MPRPVVAIVTGFTKSHELTRRSFAPLLSLKRAGVVQRILYSTWDRPDIDSLVAPIAAMPEVELVRTVQPEIPGTALHAGVAYQIRNLDAALQLVADPDALVVKLRPDFIADESFLKTKIVEFDTLCAPSDLARTFGVDMPPSPFAAKIWLPWADANQPFHYEDAAFIGLKCDVAKLANPDAAAHLNSDATSDEYAWFAHTARHATVFLPTYPIFANYVKNFRYFANTTGYRTAMLSAAVKETFFWRLVVANAWILATCYHVDCGQPRDLAFYPNSRNKKADWSNFRALRVHAPYSAVAEWRKVQHPGGILACVGRVQARLVDDSWQHALFTRTQLADLTPDNLRGALRKVAEYRADVPDVAEESFYRVVEGFYGSLLKPRAVENLSA